MNEKPSRYMPRPTVEGIGQFADCADSHRWENPCYYGLLRRYPGGFPIGGGPYAIISITATDETARHDWRDFQQLKNWLVGPEWEGIELYPAETRLLDPSNRFYLWCVPRGVITWGLSSQVRDVRGDGSGSVHKPIAPQRPFPTTTPDETP